MLYRSKADGFVLNKGGFFGAIPILGFVAGALGGTLVLLLLEYSTGVEDRHVCSCLVGCYLCVA